MLMDRIMRFLLPPWLLGKALHIYALWPRLSSCHSPALGYSYLRSQQTHPFQLLHPFSLVSTACCHTDPLTTLAKSGSTKPNYPTHPSINLAVYHPPLSQMHTSLPPRFWLRTGVRPGLGIKLTRAKWWDWCGLYGIEVMGRGFCVKGCRRRGWIRWCDVWTRGFNFDELGIV